MKKIIIMGFALLQLSSCQEVAKLVTGFKNPKIETTSTIKTYMNENNLDEGINLMSKDKKSFAKLIAVFNKKN